MSRLGLEPTNTGLTVSKITVFFFLIIRPTVIIIIIFVLFYTNYNLNHCSPLLKNRIRTASTSVVLVGKTLLYNNKGRVMSVIFIFTELGKVPITQCYHTSV